MKKVFMTFMTLVFMSSISFASSEVQSKGCYDYALNSAAQEAWHYNDLSTDFFNASIISYFSDCINAGGSDNMLDPVFL